MFHERFKSIHGFPWLFGFLRALERKVKPDTSNHDFGASDAITFGLSERDLENEQIMRWALLSAGDDRVKYVESVGDNGYCRKV